VFGGKIGACEQGLTVRRQGTQRPFVFQLVDCDKGVDRGLAILVRLGHPNFLDREASKHEKQNQHGSRALQAVYCEIDLGMVRVRSFRARQTVR
jgi:hypothetical protein